MVERIDFGAAANKDYVYRFDEVYRLIEQRSHDMVLRAARRTGDEKFFPHIQIKTAQETALPGHANYRICFWKTLQDAMAWPGCNEGWALQRVRKDHPFLAGLQQDDDEYLKDTATIFWGSFQPNPDRPDWSPDGVPHEDIEVLDLEGRWRPMNDIGVFKSTLPDWEVHDFASSEISMWTGSPGGGDEKFVFIRQKSAGGRLLLNDDAKLSWCITVISESLDGDADDYRWIYTLETSKELIGREIAFESYAIYGTGIRGAIARLMQKPHRIGLMVTDTRTISDSELGKLYRGAGVGELLWRGKGWQYGKIRRPLETPL